jgi:hypothetical protein
MGISNHLYSVIFDYCDTQTACNLLLVDNLSNILVPCLERFFEKDVISSNNVNELFKLLDDISHFFERCVEINCDKKDTSNMWEPCIMNWTHKRIIFKHWNSKWNENMDQLYINYHLETKQFAPYKSTGFQLSDIPDMPLVNTRLFVFDNHPMRMCWNIAFVLDTDIEKKMIYFRYEGWTPKWNEWISIFDKRLHSHTSTIPKYNPIYE